MSEPVAPPAIPGVAEVITSQGNLQAVWIQGSPASHGSAATIYLHGGHVAAFHPQGADEVLWLSKASHWAAEKPIRGGVPVCFPWFGPHASNSVLPAHGFARLRPWTLASLAADAAGVTATLRLDSDDATRALWPHDFTLLQHVTVGKDLVMSFSVHNPGKVPFTFQEAQHTYFTVGDVRQVAIRGLAGVQYVDKTDGMKTKLQEGDIAITAETDRVYLDTEGAVTIEDPVKRRRIIVHKEHSRNTVVWNPWIAKAKAMPDFGDDEWPTMLCIETANVQPTPVTLQPGATHLMTTRIHVELIHA